jgi:zinc transport system ATP-binding protein
LNIGYLPQKISFDSDSPVSVSDLLSSSMDRMPVWLLKTGKTRFMVDNLLKMMDASPLADRTLGELSGGELQRILLACAIANNPEILLLDEPNTGIDAGGLKLFYRLVEHIRKIHHVSIILVSHDLPGISEIADRMIFLNKTVMAEGEPSEVMANEEFIRSFSPCLWNISGFPNAGWERRRINQMEER